MAYTARLTKQQLRQRKGDATRARSRDNTKGTVQYLVTYAYTNNNCLLCASNIIVSVAIPTGSTFFLNLWCRRNRNLKILKRYSEAKRTKAPAYSRSSAATNQRGPGFQGGIKRSSGPTVEVVATELGDGGGGGVDASTVQ